MVAAKPDPRAAEQAEANALESSRMDARVLLWFATRKGKRVDKSVLEQVVTADSQLDREQRDSGNEAAFWTAFRDLAAAVRPASAESILSTLDHPFGKSAHATQHKLGNARSTKRTYTRAAVAVLVLLLLVQTYWFVMTAFSASLERNRNELDGIAGDLRLMKVLADEIVKVPPHLNDGQVADPLTSSNSRIEVQNGLPASDGVFSDSLRNLIGNSIEQMLPNRPMLAALVLSQEPRQQLITIGALSLENKTYRKNRLVSMLKNERSVLQRPWLVLWYLMYAPEEEKSQHKADAASSVSAASQQPDGFAKMERDFLAQLEEQIRDIDRVIGDDGLEQVLSRSKSIPLILSQYFLPMLYGLLGSLTYILRTISREIHDVTFTSASSADYSLRWPLGMLAGVTIGLFFDPAQFSGFGAVAPLGVAFLAGYGVEFFFKLLDGLVAVFARQGSAERAKAEAAP